jgi:microcystin degradation protein MlrC
VKIVLAGIVHETNTYCAEPTPLEAFRVERGDAAARREAGTQTYAGGMLAAAGELGAQVAVAFVADTEPSGIIRASAYDAMKEDLLSSLTAELPADAVALTLHGAGVAEGVDDLEADLCRAIRAAVGPDVRIVLSLDLHGNISQELADTVDAMFGVHLYPHTDMYERGHEAVSLLPRLLEAEVRPVTHVERVPMLIPTTTTLRGPLARVNDFCAELEARPGVIDVTLFHGFPYADVPLAAASVVATADGDRDLARDCAEQVAALVWSLRDELLPDSLSAAEAVDRALHVGRGPVVINETSDNPGGGAPGDGTHLLREMLERKLENAVFGYIADAEVVQQAQRAGVGATISVSLGGKTDELHGAPIELTAYVKCLTDGNIILRAIAAGARLEHGPMARLQVGGVDILVGTRRTQTLDPELFLLHGIDVRRSAIVALKSSNHFRAGFEEVASEIVTADTPGLTTLKLEVFPRARTLRPVWPLDAEALYSPSRGTAG